MRDFFIESLELFVDIYVVIAGTAIVVASVSTFFGAFPEVSPVLGFVSILIGGSVALLLTAGSLYLWLGIYENTRLAAALMQRQR